MFKTLFKLLFIIAIVWVVVYFLPESWKLAAKDKSFAALSKITPPSVKKKLEPLIYTPSEQRAKIISQLEANLETIRRSFDAKTGSKNQNSLNLKIPISSSSLISEELSSEEAIKKLEESRKLLEEIKKKNKDQGLAGKLAAKIITKLKPSPATSTPNTCSCDAEP